MSQDGSGPLTYRPIPLTLRSYLMVAVAQLARAPDCGSGSRGFEPRQSPLARRLTPSSFFVRGQENRCALNQERQRGE